MQNKIQLLGSYGGDKTHCLSAWQSTTEEMGIDLPERVGDRIDYIFAHIASNKKKTPAQLLNYLAQNNHETPFEKSVLHFQVTAEIASHIHALKHRTGININSESARYKEFLADNFYIPEDWLKIKVSQESKEKLKTNAILYALGGCCDWEWDKMLTKWNECAFELYHAANADLTPVLGRKRSKESSRFFLTYSTQLNFDMMFNFRSFMHFQELRNSEHAQKEICNIAQKMLSLVKELPNFTYSLAAFGL